MQGKTENSFSMENIPHPFSMFGIYGKQKRYHQDFILLFLLSTYFLPSLSSRAVLMALPEARCFAPAQATNGRKAAPFAGTAFLL